MPAINILTNPQQPGTAQLPVFAVGDDPNFTLTFSDGANLYNPGNVSVRLGFLKGLADLTLANAFQWVDRMNNQHVGSLVIASGLPNALTWDENPIGVFGANGAWRLQGRTPPASRIRKVYVKFGGAGLSTAPALRFFGGASPTGQQAEATATIAGAAITAITLTKKGFGYTTVPQIIITGDGTGASAHATLGTSNEISTIVVDSGGAGYTVATVTIVDPEATATATIGGTSAVLGATVTNQGVNYTTAPTIAVTGGGGAGATATATLLNATWGLLRLILTGAGANYTSAPAVGFSGGTGSGAAGVATISAPDQVVGATVTAGGYFPDPPSVNFSGGGASIQATARPIMQYPNGTGAVVGIEIVAPGTGYTSTPTITITHPSSLATPATATAQLGTGQITSITLTNPGAGYGATAPTVSLTGGGGSGGTATASLIGSPISPVITITAPGAGYTSAPLLGFSGGGGSGAAATSLVSLGITAVTMRQTGYAYTSLPSITVIPDNGALLIPAGVESHAYPFLQEFSPATAQQAITATPYTTGRRDSSGNLIYDDSLLIVRPRYVAQPTFALQPDGLTWAAAFTPVNAFINAVLAFRRSISVDVEVFGAGRLLYLGQLTILLS